MKKEEKDKSESDVKYLKFIIYGNYITDVCRDFFWNRPEKSYEKTLEILLGSLVCDELTEEQRIQMANKIITGEMDIVGNTGDGSYNVNEYEKGRNPNKVRNIFKEYCELKRELDKEKKEHNKIKDLYTEILSYENGEIQKEDLSDENRRNIKVKNSFYSDMLLDFTESDKFENNYGWLDPNGKFYPVEWCNHQEWADDYMKKTYGQESYEFIDKYKMTCGDFLVNVRKWILLHNPSQGTAIPSINKLNIITKKQSDFLYAYYSDRGKYDLAEKYLSL